MGASMNALTSLPLYSVGDVVVVPFPSSTGADPKRRPAVVLAVITYGTSRDYLACLITSQAAPDPTRLTLTQADIVGGLLSMQSYLRPAYLYTASEGLIVRRIGALAPKRLKDAVDILFRLLRPVPATSAD
jgi:mRNA-degrading endonuclease toxin of MazEF toxin-antitoxin module